MFTSLGKIQLISNDLEATKLLNQQSLLLSSSLKFALSLCQAFRQSCLKPSSELQTHTQTHRESAAFWKRVAVRSRTAKVTQPFGLLYTRPPFCAVLRKERTCLHGSCHSSSCSDLCRWAACCSAHPPAFRHSTPMFAFINGFNLSKINSRRELTLAEDQLWKDGEMQHFPNIRKPQT